MDAIFTKERRYYLMGISIFLITMFHWSGNASDNLLHKLIVLLFSNGNIGNNAFFLLSSYGLCFSYNNNSLGHFYKNRIFRIYPLVLVFFVIALLLDKPSLREFLVELPMQISSLSLCTDYCKAWFIQGLTILYIFFPVIYKIVLFIYHKGILFLFVLIFFCLLSSIYVCPFYAHMFYVNFTCIVLGIVMYLCEKDSNDVFLITSVGFLALLSFLPIAQGHGLTIPLIYFTLGSRCIMLLRKPLVFLGKHSLEIYLSQILVMPLIPVKGGGAYFVSLIITFCMISITACIFYYIQHYCISLKRIRR